MKPLTSSLALLALAMFAGCSAVHPSAYSAGDESLHLLNRETNGLRFSVDAVVDRPRSRKYFGTDVLRKGIVPVFVRVENVSSPGSVLVEKERFRIAVNADAQGQSVMTGEVKHETAGGMAVEAAGVLALSTPLLIVGSAMISSADEVRHNFVDKEFRNQSLAPGRSAQGFVYCQLPDRRERVDVVNIFLTVRNLQTDQPTVCEFQVHHEN